MTLKSFLLCALVITSACNKEEEDSIISGPAFLTAAKLAGTWTVCQDASTKGSDLAAPSSFENRLTINADSTYTFNQSYYTGSTDCTPFGGPGPFVNVLNYSQQGTITPIGFATLPTGATQVEFHSSGSSVTFYSTTVRDHAIASCFGLTMATAMMSIDPDSQTCNLNGFFVFDEFAGAVFTTYNVLSLDTTTTPHTLSTGDHFDWQPGMGGYLPNLTLDYEKN